MALLPCSLINSSSSFNGLSDIFIFLSSVYGFVVESRLYHRGLAEGRKVLEMVFPAAQRTGALNNVGASMQEGSACAGLTIGFAVIYLRISGARAVCNYRLRGAL